MWSDSDMETKKLLASVGGNADLVQSMLRRGTMEFKSSPSPPFYDGPSTPCSFHIDRNSDVVMQLCNDFQTDFIYSPRFKGTLSNVPTGARTRDSAGHLLAEAKVSVAPARLGSDAILVVEEVYYGGENCVRFCAKSIIDGRGFKTRELEHRGSKPRDYYFFWPINMG
jgi:hypothetical protein